MKLGTQTGSVMNHLYSRMTKGQPKPEVGMGATILSWTDRHAATITNVEVTKNFIILTVQEDNYKLVKGSQMDGSAEYEFTPNPNGRTMHFRFEAGAWRQIAKNSKTGRLRVPLFLCLNLRLDGPQWTVQTGKKGQTRGNKMSTERQWKKGDFVRVTLNAGNGGYFGRVHAVEGG